MSYELYNRWRYALSYSAINYTQAGVAALITFILADLLTVQDFGEYRFGITCLSIISVVGLFGAEKGMVIDLVHNRKERPTIFGFWVLRLTISVMAVALLVGWVAISENDQSNASIALVYSIAGLGMALRSPGWFDFRRALRQHAMLLLMERSMFLVIALLLLYSSSGYTSAFSLGVVAIITVLFQLVVEILIINRVVCLSETKWLDFRNFIVDLFARYQWVWYLSLSNLLMTSVGQLVLYQRGSGLDLAYLGLALQFAAIARLFVQQVIRLQGPSIAMATNADTKKSDMFRHMRKTIVRIGIGGLIMALCIGIVAQIILTKFFDGNYIPTIPIVWILMIWVQILGIGIAINRYLIAKGLQKFAFYAGMFWGIISIVIIYKIAPSQGAFGYSAVLVSCHGASVLSQFLILLLKSDSRNREVVPRNRTVY